MDGASYAQKRDPRVLEVLDAAASMAGADVELPPGSKPPLHLMVLYAFHRVRRLVGVAGPRKSALSRREREVLVWAAHGESAWEIGEILHITRRTVNEHTQSACRRLGAVNRTQAVAIALRDHIIDAVSAAQRRCPA